MSLRIDLLNGKVFVDGNLVTAPQVVRYENCVTVGVNSSVSIFDGAALAATLSHGAPPTGMQANGVPVPPGSGGAYLATHSPPVTAASLIYYRRSYRTQINTPGGSVGIRV